MMRICLFIIVALHAVNASAQAPGYMGKHLQIYGMLEPVYAIRPSVHEFEYYTETYGIETNVSKMGIELNPGFGIEYTLTKTITAGINMRFIHTDLPLNMYFNQTVNEYVPPAYFGESVAIGRYTGFYLKIYPHYKQGFIAPVGRYHQLEFITGKTHAVEGELTYTNYYDLEYQKYYGDYYASDFVPHTSISELYLEDITCHYFRYTFGNETVFFNVMPVDFGVQFTVPFSSRYPEGEDYVSEGDGVGSYHNHMWKATYASLWIGLTARVGLFVF